MAFDVQFQEFEANPAAVSARLIDWLAETRRVYRQVKTPVLADPATGVLVELNRGRNSAALSLINAGLLNIVQHGRPMPFTSHRDRFVNNLMYIFYDDNMIHRLPEIKQVTYLPQCQIRTNGRKHDNVTYQARLIPATAGYCAETGTLYIPRSGINIETEPDPAYPHLHKLFSGLNFTDPVYHANLIAVLMSCFARSALTEFPLILFDSILETPDGKSIGKTKALGALAALLVGHELEPMAYTGNEEQFKKDLSSFAAEPGPIPIFIDNIRPKSGQGRHIRNQILKIATSSHVINLRPHYKGLTPLYSPIIMMTMNGARVETDLADSTVRISLAPTKRVIAKGHDHIDPHPVHYALENRNELIAEINYALSRVQLESLKYQTFHTRFYNWEEIATKAARIVGFNPSFDPEHIHSVDVIVHQLYHLIEDEKFQEATFWDLANAALRTGHCSELRLLLGSTGRSLKGQAEFLKTYVQRALTKHRYRVEDKWFRFVIGETSNGDTTISIKHEE